MGANVMTSKEVTQKVMNKKELFIFDVRNESDFHDWKIESEDQTWRVRQKTGLGI